MERVWLKSYPSGVPTEIDPGTFRSLAEFFAASVAKYRRRTAFISMGRAMSYAELDRLSRDFASYLQNVARLPRGARVAVMMPNLLQYPIAVFGILARGIRRGQLQPALFPARTQRPARQLRRRGDRGGGEFRPRGRAVARGLRHQAHRNHRGRRPARACAAASSTSCCATSSAPCRRGGCRTPSGSTPRSRSALSTR